MNEAREEVSSKLEIDVSKTSPLNTIKEDTLFMAIEQIALQSVLGFDNSHSPISLLRQNGTNTIQVYFGVCHLETIPDDSSHITFKVAVGRLYNANLNRKSLSATFGFDRRTIQRWGRALHTTDPDQTIKMLSGQGNRKLTTEIIEFAHTRFVTIYAQNRYDYSKQIRKEIEDVYHIAISAECLRPYFTEWKKTVQQKTISQQLPPSCSPEDPQANRHDAGECCDPTPLDPSLQINRLEQHAPKDNRKDDVSCSSKQWFVHHAGVCLFSWYFTRLEHLFPNTAFVVKQWFCMILLECVNIEQSKYLNFTSLSRLLGSTVRLPFTQREHLNDIADVPQCLKLWELNAKQCLTDDCYDFYYDPHTKHYTGMSKILKGWCSSIGHADKVLHMDCIHSAKGEPLFMNHYDNYYDLRERYQSALRDFRAATGICANQCITVVFDRGIFKQDLFTTISADPTLEVITWEKDFHPDTSVWEVNQIQYMSLTKYRNNSQDLLSYTFGYIEEVWSKNSAMRRIVVKATNPYSRTVELGIVSTDRKRPANEIITLMFSRWIQENDFKYLEKHYGINQIISYDTIDYKELQSDLDDKEQMSGTYNARLYDKCTYEKKHKDLIYKKHLLEKNVEKTRGELQDIDIQLKQTEEPGDANTKAQLLKRRKSKKANLSRWKKISYDELIRQCEANLEVAVIELEKAKEKVSKIDTLIKDNTRKLDTRKKRFMDVLKIVARNAFYKLLEPFKIAYDNYRDDHDYFRNLTHAPGIYRETETTVEIILCPTAHLAPKIRTIVEKILADITQSGLETLDGAGKKLILSLHDGETIEVANAK